MKDKLNLLREAIVYGVATKMKAVNNYTFFTNLKMKNII